MNDTQVLIPIELIDPNPYQPRQTEDPIAIAEIAASIKQNGLMQVPSGRQVDGRYQLAFGHTRLAAFKLNSEPCMPLIIRDLTDLQMFELGVAENIKRRDLNPIEQAEAMKRYMQEFDKNSVQTGEFFGVSEEQVRGTVRLTNLVPAAQTALAAGTINITTARSLLSMQKIASEQVVAETVKKIEKRQSNEHPDETITDVIEHKLSNDVVTMWDEDNQSGKAMSNRYHGGWPLDMKRFPNGMLPALAPVDAVVALGVPDKQDVCEIVGFYLDAINNPGDYGDIEDAQAAAQFRQDQLIAVDPSLMTRLQHLLTPPACNSCPFYTKIRGTHFCGVKLCHERKTSAWNAHLLDNASKNLGIAIYDKPRDGGFKVLDWEDKSLFTKRDKGLRLISKSLINGYAFQSFDGVEDDVFVVIATGTALDKMRSHKTSVGGKKTEKEKAEMRAMKLFRQRRKELLWEYSAVAMSIFESVPASTVEILNRWRFIGIDDRVPVEHEPGKGAKPSEKEEFERRELVWRLVVDQCSHYRRESLLGILNDFAEITGVRAPKALVDKVTQWDEEIKTVSTVTLKNAKSQKGQ